MDLTLRVREHMREVRSLCTCSRPMQTSPADSKECSSISKTFSSSSSSPIEEGCHAHGAVLVCQHHHAAPPDGDSIFARLSCSTWR